MAESVVSFVVERVADLLIEEAKFLYGVEDQILDLHTELLRMQCFLEDADSIQERNKRVSNWIAEIREITYKTEDVLESFIFKVASRRRSGLGNTLKRLVFVLDEGLTLHKVGSEIETIKIKITNLTARLQTYGIRDLTRLDGGGGSASAQQRRVLLRRTYSHVVEEDFVGFEKDIEEILRHLLVDEEEDKLQTPRVVVSSIWGSGGQGKTTLARKIYHHEQVRSHFEAFAWACISQQWNKEDVLKGILTSFMPEKRETIANMRDAELMKQLFKFQEKKKCLVVFDDVWSNEFWDYVKPAFPRGKMMKSKILLTTRIKDVASYIDPGAMVRELQPLNCDESWELFKKKAFTQNNAATDWKEELGREMVSCCQGLPLSIVLLGGLLATKSTLDEWKKTHQNFVNGGKFHGHGEREVLALSYSELPYRLKPCFLYLANFPENFDIEAEKLYQLWLPEGIVAASEDEMGIGAPETMMDVAEACLSELVKRCMVQAQLEDEYSVGNHGTRFKSCRLHDLMRELCVTKAKEESFVTVFDQNSRSTATTPSLLTRNVKMHRLAFHLDKYANGGELSLGQEKSIRSVIIFYSGYSARWSFWNRAKSQLSKAFKLLRVLDLQGINFVIKRLPKGVGKLIHLRYLSIRNTEFAALPSAIGRLRYLETLDLRTRSKRVIPNVLSKMERLRHLYLPFVFLTEKGKLRLGSLTKLETLENFDARKCYVKDLTKLTNLRKLVGASIWQNHDDLDCIINYLGQDGSVLQQTYIAIHQIDFSSGQELSRLTKLLGCRKLNMLEISGRILKLPEIDTTSSRLTELWLAGSRLDEDPMPVLEKLPNLRRIALINNAFAGKKMVCSKDNFRELRYLLLRGLNNLEEWTVDKGAMENLSIIKIHDCKGLKMVPDGLRFIRKLQELSITEMPESFKKRVRVVKKKGQVYEGEDLDKVRHIPFISIDPYMQNQFPGPRNGFFEAQSSSFLSQEQ